MSSLFVGQQVSDRLLWQRLDGARGALAERGYHGGVCEEACQKVPTRHRSSLVRSEGGCVM
jgi:hypothetical protein